MSCTTCLNIASANKYLAEDRILCFEIFNKRKNDWLLRYVKEAKAETDAPDNFGGFLNQVSLFFNKKRRRWLNGSLFSFISGFTSMFQVFSTDHSFGRKLAFIGLMFYLLLDTIFTVFSLLFN
jgi:chitin synthase